MGDRIQAGQGEVLPQGATEQQGLLLSILGNERDTRTHGIPGARELEPLTVKLDRSRAGAVRTEQQARHLGPPRAHQPGEADHLTRAKLEIDPAHTRQAGESASNQPNRTGLGGAGRELLVQGAPDHRLDPLPAVGAPGGTGQDETAVAEIALRRRSFARWDAGVHDWVVDPGDWEIVVAASARDIRDSAPVSID